MMAIGNAIQSGTNVHVFDDKGKRLFIRIGVLHGFTAGTVIVRQGAVLHTFDAKGTRLSIIRG